MSHADFAAICAEIVPRVVTGAVALVMAYISVAVAANAARGRHA